MSERFRVVGSQNLTGAAFSKITVNAQAQSVLGRTGPAALPPLPSLDAVHAEGALPSAGLPIAAAGRIGSSASQGVASVVGWAGNAYSEQGDTNQDVTEGARGVGGVADTARSAYRAVHSDTPTSNPNGAVPGIHRTPQSAARAAPGSGQPPGPAGSPAMQPTGMAAGTPGQVGAPGASAGQGAPPVGLRTANAGRVADTRIGAERVGTAGNRSGRSATKAARTSARQGAGKKATGVGRASGGPQGSKLLHGGPGGVRIARGTQPVAGLAARSGAASRLPRAATGAKAVGRVSTRGVGQAARSSAQAVTRLAVMFKQATIAAMKGGVAAAASPTTWVAGGVAALLLVMFLTAGQLIGGVSASVAGSQQESGACAATEMVPEQGQAWLSEAVSSSGLPAAFLARVISRESDWRPDVFAADSNGGTWGLFQINRSEWARLYPASAGVAGTPPGITDPMLHARLGGLLMKQNYETALRLQAAHPSAAYAQIDPLEAAVIIHNAGQGALERYPNIPAITRDYVAEVMAGNGAPGAWTHPAPNATMTSQFGYRMHPIYGYGRLHAGTDFAAGPGSPIHAANSGTVTFAGFDASGNGTIRVDHGGGISTVYLHMYASGIHVRTGQSVSAGQIIGAEGSSGVSTGSHLHFEVHRNGVPIDPLTFLNENVGQLSMGVANCGGGDLLLVAGGATPVVQTAMSFQGVPYVWGGSTPAGFDCSGLMRACQIVCVWGFISRVRNGWGNGLLVGLGLCSTGWSFVLG